MQAIERPEGLTPADIEFGLRWQNKQLNREGDMTYNRHSGGVHIQHFRKKGWRRIWNMRMKAAVREYNLNSQ